jgi:hypothetical protein
LRFVYVSLILPATVVMLLGPEAAAGAEVLPGSISWASQSTDFAADARTGHGNRQHTVHLRADGNLTGRVSRFLSSGAFVPAQARVRLIRDSGVVASARSNDHGMFQLTGLDPAVYWVIADGLEGCSVFSVRVSAPDASIAEERMWLHMTLAPRSTLDQLSSDPVAECEAQPPLCPVAQGEACRGGAGAALIGSAGLAGLAGVSGEASPANP